MSKELIDRLKSYIPSGDGPNSQYANDLADAVAILEAKAAPVGEREAFEAAHKKLHPQVKIRVRNLVGAYTDQYVDHAAFWFSEGAAYQRQSGVVMPERQSPEDEWHYVMRERSHGWNACLDEFARLNGKEVGRG